MNYLTLAVCAWAVLAGWSLSRSRSGEGVFVWIGEWLNDKADQGTIALLKACPLCRHDSFQNWGSGVECKELHCKCPHHGGAAFRPPVARA